MDKLIEKYKLPSDAARNISIDVLGLDKVAELGNNDSQLAFDIGVIQDLTVKAQLEYAIPIISEEIKKELEEDCPHHICSSVQFEFPDGHIEYGKYRKRECPECLGIIWRKRGVESPSRVEE